MVKKTALVFNTSVFVYNEAYGGDARVWVGAASRGRAQDYSSDSQSNNWALVLDRHDPQKPPVFSGTLSSNTDVPAALAAAMSPDNILLYMCSGLTADIPQGALFQLLAENGGGSKLEKLEQFALFNGSGMSTGLLYTLVSVPGSNMPGIEGFAQDGSGTSLYVEKRITVAVYGALSQVISLIPDASGGYVPVELG